MASNYESENFWNKLQLESIIKVTVQGYMTRKPTYYSHKFRVHSIVHNTH